MTFLKVTKRSLWRTCSVLATVLVLAACGSTPRSSSSANTNEDPDVSYAKAVDKFIANPKAEEVPKVFLAYVESSIPDNIWDIRDDFAEIQTSINNGESCSRYDWNKLISQNIMRLQRHISAIECYQSLGDEAATNKHIDIFEALIGGISLNLTGDDYTVAYQVLVEEDAQEFLAFAGYDIITMEYELIEGDDGIYLVYTVEDQETGKQEQIYFDHQRFLHRIYEVDYPFSGKPVLFTKRFLPEMKSYNSAAFTGLADGYIINWGDMDGATENYLRGIAWGHTPALHKLAEACFNYELPQLNRLECVDLLVDAAEEGYLKSAITLAYLYHDGVIVEQDQQLAEEILQTVANQLPQGEAHWQFFKLVLAKPFTDDYIAVEPHQIDMSMELQSRFTSIIEAAPYLVPLTKAIKAGSETARVFKDYYLPALADGKVMPFNDLDIYSSNEANAWRAKAYLTMLINLARMDENEIQVHEDAFIAMQKEAKEIAKKDKRYNKLPNYNLYKALSIADQVENNFLLAGVEFAYYHAAAIKHNMVAKYLLVDWLNSYSDTNFAKKLAAKNRGYKRWLSNCMYHNLRACVYFDVEERYAELANLSGEEKTQALEIIVRRLLSVIDEEEALELLRTVAAKHSEVKDMVIAEQREDIAQKL